LVAEKSYGAKRIDDETEEEAETEVKASAEQEKPLADNPDNADETILDKDPGKDKVHEEPETNHKVKYDKNNAVKTQMYVKPELRDGMLKTNPKEIKMFKEPEMRMLKTTLKGTYDKNVNMDHVMFKKPEMNVNVEHEAGIQVHQCNCETVEFMHRDAFPLFKKFSSKYQKKKTKNK
jgi:hypothetical protein